MSKTFQVKKVSSVVRALVLFFIILDVGSLLFFGLFSTVTGTDIKLHADFGFMYSALSHSFDGSWSGIAQALADEGFNGLLILGFADMIPRVLIYLSLFKLFGLYQQGQIFSADNIRCIKNIGTILLAWVGLKLLYPIIVTLVIRGIGLSDSLSLYISLGSTELQYFLIGLIIYVIAWVMSEARSLHQEQDLVI